MKLLYYIRRFWEITRTEKILFIKGAVFSGFFRLLTLSLPMKYYLYFLKNTSFEAMDSDKLNYNLYLVNKTLKRIVRFMPWKSNCLIQSMTRKRLLCSFNINSQLILKIHKTESKILIAHASIEVNVPNNSCDHFKIAI
jgi:hypothetical protein